ncbi:MULTISPECIES: YbdD/YjiX family protein [unclassified Moraxella]|uniref:YbdD/YjiX family protein n=1 Tax=unclassified Moraxella TaxID=2685852 RepID=UPI003AF9BBA1
MDNRTTLVTKLIKFTLQAQKDVIFSPKNISRLMTLVKRLQQSFRLMVGVADYPTYLSHMQQYHPDLEPMDEKTFFRYCVDARYPTGGDMKRCPC